MKYLILIMFFIFMTGGCGVYDDTLHPALKIESYEYPLEGSLEERIEESSEILLDYLTNYDQVSDDFYKPYYPSEEEFIIIGESFKELPKAITDEAEKVVVGIYFVENFIGGGMVEWFFDKDNNYYTWIVFNPDILNHNVSSWLSLRDSSCFTEKTGYKIVYDAGETNAFTYMLFHEIMHVIDISKNITPHQQHFTTGGINEAVDLNDFTRDIWSDFREVDNSIYFPMKDKLTFYGLGETATICISESPLVYDLVEKSPFVSLYSLLNFMEDFAEIGAIYLHSELHGRPYGISVIKEGEEIYSFKNPLDRENIKDRLIFVKDVLGL